MQPVETRFGPRSLIVEKAVMALAELWGETIVPCGASAANILGLTTQNPVLSVYLTSGPNRDCVSVHRKCACAMRRAGNSWHRTDGLATPFAPWHGFGPREVEDALATVVSRLSDDDVAELAAARAIMPAWMAEPVSALVADG